MIQQPQGFQGWNRRQRLWGTAIALVGVGALLGGVRAWWFVNNELAPEISQQLQKRLNRPVHIGNVERVGLNFIRFGASEIPSYRDAGQVEPDSATLAGIDVSFNLWQILTGQKLTIGITLHQPQLTVVQDRNGQWWRTEFTLPPEQDTPFDIGELSLRLRNGSVVVQPFAGEAYVLEHIHGGATLTPNPETLALEGQLEGQFATGGQWRIEGSWNQPTTTGTLQIRGKDIALTVVNDFLPETVAVEQGQLDGQITVALPLTETPDITGQVWLRGVALRSPELPQGLKNVNAHLQLQGDQARVHYLRGDLANVQWQAKGTVGLRTGWQIDGEVGTLDLAPTFAALDLEPPVRLSGQIHVPQLQIRGDLNNPQLGGELRSQTPLQVDQLRLQSVTIPFAASLEGLQLRDVSAEIESGGTLNAELLLLPTGQFQGRAQVRQVALDAITATYGVEAPIPLGQGFAQVVASGNLADPQTWLANAEFELPTAQYPLKGTAQVSQAQLLVPNFQVQLFQGTLQGRAQARGGRWQLQATAENVALRQFSPQLQGQLNGEAIAQGQVDQFSLGTTTAQANLRVSPTPTGDPLLARLGWDGQQLRLQEATLGGVSARGTIDVDVDALEVGQVQLGIRADNLSLGALSGLLAPALPIPVDIAGTTSLQGTLRGSLDNLQFQGTLQTRQLAVNDLRFAPLLRGSVAFSPQQGAALRLQGGGDRLEVSFGTDWQPQLLDIQQQEARLVGQRQGDSFAVSLQQFPLERLRIRPPELPATSILAGTASGQLRLQGWQSGQGSLTIERPGLGAWRGDRLEMQFALAPNRLSLGQGEFQKGESRYQFSADLQPQRLAAQLNVAQGNLDDLTGLATVLGLGGAPVYGRAADLGAPSAGAGPDALLLTQIRRLAEIEMLQAQAAVVRRPQLIPPLAKLCGGFSGQVTLSQTPQSGLVASFDFTGQDWTWGNYAIDRVLSRGRFAQDQLVLSTLEVVANGGQLQLNGTIGGRTQQAQLTLQQFPISIFASLLPPGIDLEGTVNGNAVLTGTWRQPLLVGEASLVDARLNQRPLEAANATFRYGQNRLALQAAARFDTPEPLTITGSVPLRYPLDPEPIADSQLALDVAVKDEGLALMNALTDQVQWQQGKGLLQAQLRGTWRQPVINGVLSVDDAVLKTPTFAAPLTNVSARVRFDRDRLRVDGFQGLFSQGQITMAGVLPLQQPLSADEPDAETPLTLTLNQLQVNANEIYQGTVNGTLVITDTLLSPDIGGTVQLSRGRLDLGAIAGLGNGNDAPTPQNSLFDSPMFENLNIELVDSLQVTRAPFLNLNAKGSLTLNGGLDTLQPEGEIRLTSGQLNLFTTLFLLQQRADNYVRFTPANGLDPELNLTLAATATEVFTPGTTRLGDFSTATATSIGTLNTVRITARINGRASQFQTNLPAVLELSSSPPRSNAELLTLMGGGTSREQDQVSGEALVANIAGSALFNNLQAAIDRATGNRTSFRIFPAVVPPDRKAQSSSPALAVGAEVGFQINNFTSVSLLQLLTAPSDPTRFNLGFQINEHIRLGSQISTNAEGTGFLEFRRRF